MNKFTRSKNGFTLIEIMVVVMIIGLLLAIALPNFLHARADSRYKAIIYNLQKIDAAKNRWAMANSKNASDVPTFADLVPTYIENSVSGPIAGTYVPNAVNQEATFKGETYDQWVSNCSADPTLPACGL